MKAKPPKSPALAAVNQDLDQRYERIAKGMNEALKDWFGFPHCSATIKVRTPGNQDEKVFCGLRRREGVARLRAQAAEHLA